MAILVTGGAGYIGSHTCINLLNAGYEIVVVDNFSNSKPEVIERIKQISRKNFLFYQVDLLDEVAVENIFRENDISAVIHFAGFKAVGESVNIPLSYYHNNITSTLILCEIMKKYGVKKMVFSSSATVYGDPEKCPIPENSTLSTTNPYGSTKLMIEQILRDLGRSDHDWSIALLRYFNPIGAHESGLIGEDPHGIPNNLLPYISKVAAGDLPFLNIFGDDYDTKDGTGVRDYIHVVDLSMGHIRALEKILTTKGVEAYNLGTGKGYSVLEVIKAFEKVSGQRIHFKVSSRRPGDIATCYADIRKAKNELNWQASKTIEDMCQDTWNFSINNIKV
ncbi:UDP-glucose 4-epimerase GalE [Priestia flexa]|uniref:UDP-glucose 4-epimerase GalE n=1 Tax=Priestia flexa TaxID=86664 RepID=UPI00095733E7|nr:UDP-glucose 4-epimerase GalE [Priestia flexa]MBY6085945.1 UDP-glucose 4-epimerase GalE [Priestia flexa]SIQ24850.1 UDP-galactose 4-epimerase [Priestia flexa]